jgi:hypothetical protein
MKIVLSFLLVSVILSCSKARISDNEVATNINDAIHGVYSIDAVTSGIAVDVNGDGQNNTNLLLESDCYSSGKMVLAENGSLVYVCSIVENSNNRSICLEQVYEGAWEVKQNRDGEALIMAYYLDEDGEEQNLMLCKNSSGLHLNYIMADIPDTATTGKPLCRTGKLSYVFKKHNTDIL